MKKFNSIPQMLIGKISMFITMLLVSLYTFAQEADKKVDVSINTKGDGGSSTFNQPWVWVVGGAVFLLLLVALLRNNNSRNS